MKILLLGYGKMGQTIDNLIEGTDHSIIGKITSKNRDKLDSVSAQADVAIEFTEPESAVANYEYCFENNIPVVSGTTGWLDQRQEVEETRRSHEGRFFYASNFSIGVNLFFKLNNQLAALMNGQGYTASMEEIHHTHKKDEPSGTAITLAEGIISASEKYNSWHLGEGAADNVLPITSKRIDPTPGTHIIKYDSPIDTIEIKHTAHSREGFAKGAIMTAEWLINQPAGSYEMSDYLNI